MLRAAVYQVLILMPGDMGNSFRCAQSILINCAAAGLMLFAVRRRNREIRNVAVLVTMIGAIKVFLYDMLQTHGVPSGTECFHIRAGRGYRIDRTGAVATVASRISMLLPRLPKSATILFPVRLHKKSLRISANSITGTSWEHP